MKSLILTIILSVLYIFIKAQSFEGIIYFEKLTAQDTINYAYLIKDNMMRVDEMDKSLNILQSLLINLNDKSMIAISPAHKMYMPFPVKPIPESKPNEFRITKTNNSKVINNYTCNKWEIRQITDSIIINYWVVNDNFDFFLPFLNISNTSDKSAFYYLQFNESEGFFPMLSVETDFNEKLILKLKVTKVEKKGLLPELFKIPPDYISFQR